MCTVTLVPTPGGPSAADPGFRPYRLASNRDERRNRPAARPPGRRVLGGRHVLMPVDPSSGGTWFGVNDAGLAATLLNTYAAPLVHADGTPVPGAVFPPGRVSRGTIVPALLAALTARDAAVVASRLDPADYAPFRVLGCDGRAVLTIHGDGQRVRIDLTPWDGRPRMLTSSGMGDAAVEPTRQRWFDAAFSAAPGPAADTVRSWHARPQAERPSLGVCMRRPDAQTVSYTEAEVGADDAVVLYHGGPPDSQAARTRGRLVRVRAGLL